MKCIVSARASFHDIAVQLCKVLMMLYTYIIECILEKIDGVVYSEEKENTAGR